MSALVIWLPFTKDTFDVLQTDNVDSGHQTAASGHGAHTWKRGELCCRHSVVVVSVVVSVASLSDSWQPVDHRIVPCRAMCHAFFTSPGDAARLC